MQCKVYRSESKAYTYLYLSEDKELEDLPEFLLEKFGSPELILELDLSTRQKLAHADLGTVKSQLTSKGYYLQLPPQQSVDDLLQRNFS
jgi:hypothetical protein